MNKQNPLRLLPFIVLLLPLVNAADTNVSLQYVWNSSCTANDDTCWIPWLHSAT